MYVNTLYLMGTEEVFVFAFLMIIILQFFYIT